MIYVVGLGILALVAAFVVGILVGRANQKRVNAAVQAAELVKQAVKK